jgi:hypothetical protein
LALWAGSLPGIRPELMNDYGLLPALPYTFFVSLLLLTVSFVWALRSAQPATLRLGLHVVALVVMLHAVEPLVFPMPEYVWTYKHIGVAAYIAQHGSVDEHLDIYQNWPGFFALAAWFNQVAGVGSATQYAAWAPVYFGLLTVLVLGFALPALTASVHVRWLTMFIFVAANWVGQDYFSPQALAFVLSLATLATVLRYLRSNRPAQRLVALQRRLRPVLVGGGHHVDAAVQVLRTTPRSRWLLLLSVYAMFAVLVITHQLSPYMVLIGVAGLTVLDLVRPRWLLAGLALLAVGFLLTRVGYLSKNYGELSISFNPLQNTHNQSVGWSQGMPGRQFGAQAARTLSLGVWALALIGAVRRFWNGSPTMVSLGLAMAPVGLVLVQDYGGEAIYRVFLFSLPWSGFLAASAITPRVPWNVQGSLGVAAVLIALVALFLPSYFGLEQVNEVRPAEVAASQYYYDHVPRNSVLVLGVPNFPARVSGNYDRSRLVHGGEPSLADLPRFQGKMLTSTDLPDVEALVRQVEAPGGNGYLAISTGMKVYCHVYSVLPDGSLDSLSNALAHSPRWRVFYQNNDAVIYQLVAPPPSP